MKYGKHRSRLNKIVFLLAGLLIAFCVFRTAEDKGRLDLGLPDTDIPFLDTVGEYISAFLDSLDFPETEAPAVPAMADGALEVHFLDVGQGKSILVKSGGETALIDVGENGQGAAVISYLKRQKSAALMFSSAPIPTPTTLGIWMKS